jgi:hypothetical protein
MRSRFVCIMVALLVAGPFPGSSALAKPETTISFEITEVEDDSCENYFAIARVNFTGFGSDGYQYVVGTFTEPGVLETLTDVAFSHSRRPSRTRPAIIFAIGPFPEGSRIGADVTLLFHGEVVGETFVDFGTCT